MPNASCPRCGAPGDGFVCAYCGAELAAPGDERAELAALEQYHKHVEAAPYKSDQCSRLIAQGYVPRGEKALIEAGLYCLPRIDYNKNLEGCHSYWADRLEAITTRLKVMPGPEAARAAAELEAKHKAWRAQSESDFRYGLGCFSFLALVIIASVWALISRLK